MRKRRLKILQTNGPIQQVGISKLIPLKTELYTECSTTISSKSTTYDNNLFLLFDQFLVYSVFGSQSIGCFWSELRMLSTRHEHNLLNKISRILNFKKIRTHKMAFIRGCLRKRCVLYGNRNYQNQHSSQSGNLQIKFVPISLPLIYFKKRGSGP